MSCTAGCNQGRDCTCDTTDPVTATRNAGACGDCDDCDDHREPMTRIDLCAVMLMLAVSAAIVCGAIGFFYQLFTS